jgi:hypothetical protein
MWVATMQCLCMLAYTWMIGTEHPCIQWFFKTFQSTSGSYLKFFSFLFLQSLCCQNRGFKSNCSWSQWEDGFCGNSGMFFRCLI